MSKSSNPYRLDGTVIPRKYRLFLDTDLQSRRFAGRVEIEIEIAEPTSDITLNSVELDLGAASIKVAESIHRSISHDVDTNYGTATFKFESEIPTGVAILDIEFSGELNELLSGFYHSTFVDDDGVVHDFACTQFEPSDARRAFPCWDEPVFKATYQINLTIQNHLVAYSNSPIISDTQVGNGLHTVRFAPTVRMSTYLVALVIGSFEETSAIDVDGLPLRVVHNRGKSHLVDFALEVGAFALRFFSDYFDITCPSEKLDMIAIPNFASGAMENLGCITFRETELLIDKEQASVAELARVAEAVSHEIAHMWFGGLVTMEWWEGLWLNEAFATFMQVLCTDAFRPEWNLWVSFGVARDAAMKIDGLHSTRPIVYSVTSPSDALGMFDQLTYKKGGSILRMLEQFLGENAFRDGVRHYLKAHSYANTTTKDLWDSLEEISSQPVCQIMDTWFLQGGHPLVTLEHQELTQEPFIYAKGGVQSSIGTAWKIPVVVRTLDTNSTSRYLLGETPINMAITTPVLLNAGGSGTFRSRYGKSEFASVASRIRELSELERATFLGDCWSMVVAGQSEWEDFILAAMNLGDQDEPMVWLIVGEALDYVHRALLPHQRKSFVKVVHDLIDPQFSRLGWNKVDGESELAGPMRSMLIDALGIVGDDAAIQAESFRRFDANEIDNDHARSILRIVAHQNRPGDYEIFLERFRCTKTSQDAQRYLWFGFPAFSDELVALDIAEKCFSEFQSQDAAIVLGLMTRNMITGPTVWRYLTSRWTEALKIFPQKLMFRMTAGVPTFISDKVFANSVERFLVDNPILGGQRQVDQAIEQMNLGVAFAVSLRQQL